MYMTRIDSPATQFGQLVFRGDFPSMLIDHGGGPGGLPQVDPKGYAVTTRARAEMGTPDAEAGLPDRPASHLLWGDRTDLRTWAALHPDLVMRAVRPGALTPHGPPTADTRLAVGEPWRDE